MPKPLIRDIIVKKKQILREPAREPARKIPGDTWDKAISDGVKEEKRKKKLKLPRFKFPRFHFRLSFPRLKSKFKFILGIIALGILAAGGIVLLNKLFSITVEITPRQEFVDVDTVFNASIESQNGELSLEVMRLSRQEEGTAPAMGTKQVSKRASGQVVIYNAFTSQPQSLVAGTRLEASDGKIYRIDKSVIIPGAKIEKGEITPSEILVTVYADKPGEEYNAGLTDFAIPGFKDQTKREQIYGRSKTEMKGGFVGEVSVINEKDIADLDSSLKEKIRDYLFKMVGNPKPDQFLLYDNARQIVFDEQKNAPKAGEETNSFTIKESAVLFGFLLKKSDIDEALGKKYLDPEIVPQIEVVNAANLDFELKKFTATTITFGLKGKVHFVWKIDEPSLKNDIVKEKGNPESVFQKYPAIKKAKIVFEPSWWRHIPQNPSHIAVKRILENNP